MIKALALTENSNKRPKGPHIMHLSTMCHLFDRSARTAIFVNRSALKTQSWKRTLGSCCQVSLNSIQWFQRKSWKFLSQSEAGAAILLFSIGPKNTKLVEDVETLLPVKLVWIWFSGFWREVLRSCFLLKFRWIPLSGFRGEVKNTLCWQHVINSVRISLSNQKRMSCAQCRAKNCDLDKSEEKMPVYEYTWVRLNFTEAVHKKRQIHFLQFAII